MPRWEMRKSIPIIQNWRIPVRPAAGRAALNRRYRAHPSRNRLAELHSGQRQDPAAPHAATPCSRSNWCAPRWRWRRASARTREANFSAAATTVAGGPVRPVRPVRLAWQQPWRWATLPGSADEPNAGCTKCQPELGKWGRVWRDAVYLGAIILAGHEPARGELPGSHQGLPDQDTASRSRAADTHSEDDSRVGERYAWLCTLLAAAKRTSQPSDGSAVTCGNARL
jgi:hypothetical protein